MRIAFLITAHQAPQQLARLARALTREGDDVFFHIDAKARQAEFAALAAIPNVALISDPVVVNHGGFSQVVATLKLIELARRSGNHDYFIFLSGQCFPTQSVGALREMLANSGRDHINYYRMPRHIAAKRLDRLEYFYFESGPDWLNRLAQRLPKRNIVKGLSAWPHAGSNWWALRRSTIDYIVRFIGENPAFSRFMRRTAYSDEVFFHTIISTMGIDDEISPALFWTSFNPETTRPYVWKAPDFAMLMRADAFFIRKVDEAHDAEIIELLEHHVAG